MMKSMFVALGALTVLAFATVAQAQTPAPTQGKFRLCTGGEKGVYFAAGHYMRKFNPNIEVIPSQGSLENLENIVAGKCDGAFVQSDALRVFSAKNSQAISNIERGGVLYNEYVHLLCNRKVGLSKITGLTKDHRVAVGRPGSGAWTTWESFVQADKARYGVVQTDARDGNRALAAVSDGTEVQCMLWVGAFNSPFMKVDAQRYGSSVVLVPTDDRDMKNIKDAKGRPSYTYSEIPSGTYKEILPGGMMFGTKTVDTIAVEALFVASTNFIDNNSREYDRILDALAKAKPEIRQAVGQ